MELAKQHEDGDDGDEFLDWLKKHKLHTYKQALEDEGFEVLESLISLSKEEVDSLGTAIQMKMGHLKVFPLAIKKTREGIKRKEEEQEEQRKREKAKREREEEEQEEQRKVEKELAQLKRDKRRED